MRVIFNHLTIGILYRDFWRIWPALIGTFVPFFYQLINLYGLMPALFLGLIFLGTVMAVFSYAFHLLSFFILPLLVCSIIVFSIIFLSFLTWLIINIVINRRANLKLFKLNYSSRPACILLSLFLCGEIISGPISPGVSFWDIHFRPTLAGKLQQYSLDEFNKILQDDYKKLQKVFNQDAVLFGITPGTLATPLESLGLNAYNLLIVKTIIKAKHAKIFGLTRDFFFHRIILKKSNC